MNKSDIKTALRTWIRSTSKLADKQIFWAEQGNVRPKGTFITMRIAGLVPLGATDEQTQTYKATRPPGEEIELSIQGRRQFGLSVQVFGNGDDSSSQILSRIQTSVELPSIMAIFEEASISCIDKGDIQNVTALLETTFEPRDVCDFQFYCSEVVSESNTYIQTVGLANEVNDPPTTFEVTT